jgi:sortase A
METAAGTLAPSTGRTIVRRLGLALVVLGAALIAWGLVTWHWGDPLTGLYTRWEQRGLEKEYERVVESFRPRVPPGARPGEQPGEVRREARRYRNSLTAGGAVGHISVDRLDLDMVLVYGTGEPELRRGPGVDPRTFLPGEGELVYIAGHRTTFGAPFAHIDRLRRGDRVVIEVPYGRFRYAVTRSVIVPADDIGRLTSRGREEVALQACHPRFSASERYIVYARPLADGA